MEPAIDERARLGQRISQRRRELGLSVSAAARSAGIDRGTWTGTEGAARKTEEYNWAGMERVLQWAPGSIAAILAGGDPTPLDDQPQTAALPHDFDLNAEIDKVMRLPIPAAQKLRLASQITELYEQAQAERRAAER